MGLAIFGAGIGMIVAGDNGLPGWDVFHQGLSEQLPISIGTATVVVGAIILVALLVLREPVGVGTVANVLIIGPAVDATLWVLNDPTDTAFRAALTFVGPLVVAIGSGLYIGVRLGPGPRDGLMTALGRRGITIWKARLLVEASALGAGLALGGSVGWGTVWFLIIIGPTVQQALNRFSLPIAPGEPTSLRVS